MAKDRKEIEECLAVVDAYEASGQKAGAWARANGVSIGELSSWCAHAGRWRARLELGTSRQSPVKAGAGFVRAGIPASQAMAVRVEWPAASGTLVLHWPLSHASELGAWLREVGR